MCIFITVYIIIYTFINLGLIIGDRIRLRIPKINLPVLFKRKFDLDLITNLSLLVLTLTILFYSSGIDLGGYIGFLLPYELLIFILLFTFISKLYNNEKITFKNKFLTIFISVSF